MHAGHADASREAAGVLHAGRHGTARHSSSDVGRNSGGRPAPLTCVVSLDKSLLKVPRAISLPFTSRKARCKYLTEKVRRCAASSFSMGTTAAPGGGGALLPWPRSTSSVNSVPG